MTRLVSRYGICLLAFSILLAPATFGEPAVKRFDVQPLTTVARVAIPTLNLDKIHAQDEKRKHDGLPPRYAIPHAVSMTPLFDGTWERLDDHTLMWRLRIGSPGAVSINLGFTHYQMPPGGRLYVYAADLSDVIRPFDDRDNEVHGQLWTPPVGSDEIVVELTIPEAALPALNLELGSINVGYRGFKAPSAEKSGSCNVDVVCPQGDDWRDQIASVAVISTGGSAFCTGFAVNNTARDLTPYFMTANHCGINSGNAPSLVVFWNYENSTCRPPGSAASGGPGDGSLSDFQTGAIFKASYAPSDFTLVQLDDDPDPEWEVVLAGWDHSSGNFSGAIGIHHPNVDEKRISFEYDPTETTSYLGTSEPGDGTHVRIVDWDLGTTEPGSSGSPLFNPNHHVIGQLHGGYAACGNDDSDYYGRFSMSWDGGGTSSTRLSTWLDPGNTGEVAIDHLRTGGMSVSPAGDVLHIGVVGGPFTEPTTVYTLTNPTTLPLDYEVSLTNLIGILIDGGTSTVSGTLAANGGSVDVTASLGSSIDSLPAGIYEEDIAFDDLTNGVSTVAHHTVEIGQTNFSVVPGENLDSSGPVGGPFPGSVVYTITSERPTPVTVEVAASDPWISLNGGAGPVVLNLSGTGDSAAVTVAFSAAAASLSAGVYSGGVTFTNQSGGAGDTSRSVFLDVGRVVYDSTDVPVAIPDNTEVTSTITIDDPYCIGDLDVELDITHTYIGDLIVELESPDGVTVRLHNNTGGSSANIVQTYDDDTLPPDGPGQLADYNVTLTTGTWTLHIADTASGDTGTLNHWALRIGPISSGCPNPELLYSFPLDSDPGWSTEGDWAYGQPTGGGSYAGDPTSGHTGLNVYGYNLNGDYADGMPAYYLTMPPLDLTGASFTELRFWRWIGVIVFDVASVEVSTNGTDWTPVWLHTTGSSIGDNSWTQQKIDISAVADNQPQVYIRWGMGATNGALTAPGWNIDDVEIWGDVSNEIVDCNENGIDDACDIDCGAPGGACDVPGCGTLADCNGDGIPEVCQLPDPVEPEAGGVDASRFISFEPAATGSVTAIRVVLASLYHPTPTPDGAPDYSAYEGEVRWVGPPQELPEFSEAGPPYTEPTWMGAALQCEPYYRDWTTNGLLYVYGAEIVPESSYTIQVVRDACDGQLDSESVYSDGITVTTGRLGDVVAPYAVDGGSAQPDFSDIGAVVSKFLGALDPPKVRAMLRMNVPPVTSSIDFADISSAVDGFLGTAYPYSGPCSCPSDTTCPTTDACGRCAP